MRRLHSSFLHEEEQYSELEWTDTLTIKRGMLHKKHDNANWKDREFKLTKKNKLFYMKKGVRERIMQAKN
jgi:hypothetical protein